mgnify:CR=1 FL=1
MKNKKIADRNIERATVFTAIIGTIVLLIGVAIFK